MKRYLVLLLALLPTLAFSAGDSLWDTIPGGAATSVNDADKIVINQAGASKTATKAVLLNNMATSAEVSGAITSHESASDPHPGYLQVETDPSFTEWDKDYNDLVNSPNIPQSGVDFDPVGTDNSTDELTPDQQGAIAGANFPTAANPMITQNDIGTAAALDAPVTGDAAASEVVKGDDSRLSDARTPTAHAHDGEAITPSSVTTGSLSIPQGTSAQGATFYEASGDGTNYATLTVEAMATNPTVTIGDSGIKFNGALVGGGSGVTFSASGLPTDGALIYRTDLDVLVANNGGSMYTSAFSAADESPTDFSGTFLADTDVALSTHSTCGETATIAGLGVLGAPVSITQAYNCEYQIDAGTWTSTAGRVYNTEAVGLRQVSSDTASTQQDCVLTVGDMSDTYSVTTAAASGGFVGNNAAATDDLATTALNRAISGIFTASASGTVSYMHVNLGFISGTVNCAIYSADGSTKIAESDETVVSGGDNHLSLDSPVAITLGTDYMLMCGSSDDSSWRMGVAVASGSTAYDWVVTIGDTLPGTVDDSTGSTSTTRAVRLWADDNATGGI